MEFPNKRYNVIYADPPWKQNKGGLRKERPNQTRALDYDTLSIDEIFTIQKKIRDNNTTENHVVFMWAIDKFLPEIEISMKGLGYRLHARIIWDKTNGVAPAFTIRYSHEYLLWFYTKKLMPIAIEQRGKWTTVLREPATTHSKKPTIVYQFIESIYPSQLKLEMYARTLRSGWDAWGNQVPNHCQKLLSKEDA